MRYYKIYRINLKIIVQDGAIFFGKRIHTKRFKFKILCSENKLNVNFPHIIVFVPFRLLIVFSFTTKLLELFDNV